MTNKNLVAAVNFVVKMERSQLRLQTPRVVSKQLNKTRQNLTKETTNKTKKTYIKKSLLGKKGAIRNACERFRGLKKRLLIEELEGLLPTNPTTNTPCQMSLSAVLKTATRYINILSQTIEINDTSRRIAKSMEKDGYVKEAVKFMTESTTQQQMLLNERIQNGVISYYGNKCPSQGKRNKTAQAKLKSIIEVLLPEKRTRFDRYDSLGLNNDPLTLLA